MKNYVVIVRDHSGSMRGIVEGAARDYNSNIGALKEASTAEKQDTIVSTIKCGVGHRGTVERDVVNSNVQVLKEIASKDYRADGGSTPLFDSVNQAIELLRSVPDYNDPEVSFLVMVITDGYENSSTITGPALSEKIRSLHATDRWTFAFRVPHGHAATLSRNLNIPHGNILEWEQSDRGFKVATEATRTAIGNFYRARTAGKKSLETFYTDLKSVEPKHLKLVMTDVSKKVSVWRTLRESVIRDFVERKSGKPMLKGAAFYELVKPEKNVQDYKMIVIRDRVSGAVYAGPAARQLLGLPASGDVKLVPGDHSQYDVFVQSTSVNRKLPAGSSVLYYPDQGVPFTEGVSAQWKR